MKKALKIIGIILVIVIILGLIFFIVDYNRVKNNERPTFCIKVGVYLDGGTVEFLGLGYKVIDFNTIAGFDEIKIGTWFMEYNDFDSEREIYNKKYEEQLKSEQNNSQNEFLATIEKISEYNGITSILVEGLDSNDINYRSKFDFSIDDDTEVLWRNTKIDISKLKEGQNISITHTGDVLESYPAQLTKVTKVILLDDEI